MKLFYSFHRRIAALVYSFHLVPNKRIQKLFITLDSRCLSCRVDNFMLPIANRYWHIVFTDPWSARANLKTDKTAYVDWSFRNFGNLTCGSLTAADPGCWCTWWTDIEGYIFLLRADISNRLSGNYHLIIRFFGKALESFLWWTTNHWIQVCVNRRI